MSGRMSSWSWCEREDEALALVADARAEKLYLRGLRKHMDFYAGLVGIKRRVSYQMFKELLEEPKPRGSTVPEYIPNRQQIDRLLKKLEAVGLVTRLPRNKLQPMVFRLDFADCGLVRLEEEHTMNVLTAAYCVEADSSSVCADMSVPQKTPKIAEERTTSGSGSNDISNKLDISPCQSKVLDFKRQKVDSCPHGKIIELYHQALPELRNTLAWGDKRKSSLRKTWRASTQHQSLEFWQGYFERVSKSDFLMGRVIGSSGRPFDCDLEFLAKYQNLIKVFEGKYDNRGRFGR